MLFCDCLTGWLWFTICCVVGAWFYLGLVCYVVAGFMVLLYGVFVFERSLCLMLLFLL